MLVKGRKFESNKMTTAQARPLSQSKRPSVVFSAILASAPFLLSACSSDESDERQTNRESLLAQQRQYEIAEIEDSINNSYAILAAERSDVCPKLLQKEIGNNIIKRTSEVMVDDHCDYFLYLYKGQNIAVNTNNSQIEALLVVPTIHNFADGDYKVTSYDKHVIRLAYNGATYKPERLIYDVDIIVTD